MSSEKMENKPLTAVNIRKELLENLTPDGITNYERSFGSALELWDLYIERQKNEQRRIEDKSRLEMYRSLE